MQQPLPPDVIAAMDASNKIEAIRLLRAQTGLGLADAKEAVESRRMPAKPVARPALPTELPLEAIAALQRGQKIEAIKIVRAKFGIDLKDAKEVVDAAEQSASFGTAEKTNQAPGEVPARGLGKAFVLIAVALAAIAVWWVLANQSSTL